MSALKCTFNGFELPFRINFELSYRKCMEQYQKEEWITQKVVEKSHVVPPTREAVSAVLSLYL